MTLGRRLSESVHTCGVRVCVGSRVNADMVAFVQRHIRQSCATLDMDATLVETHKQQAQYCYEKYKAYQPLTTYWHEAGLIAHTEFRDGNVPAGYQQKRVLTEALAQLPSGVQKVMVRSDTAGYQQELLRYCAKGQDEGRSSSRWESW